MKNNLGELQIFSITNEDAKKKNRVDVEYYQPFFEHIVARVSGSKFNLQKLEDVTLLISNGRTPSKDMYDEDNDQVGSVPIIKAGTASGRFVDLKKLEYAKADFTGGKKAQKNDIFVLSAAHQASYVGKNVSILDVEPPQDTFFVGELICVRANSEKVLPEYLFGFLSSKVGYLLLNREKRGQTSHIYPEDVKSILLPVPSLKDQKNIVSILMKAYEQKKTKEAEILKILSSIDDFVLGELGIDMPRGGAEQVFQIWSDEVSGSRLDPAFYRISIIKNDSFSKIGSVASVQGGFAFKSNEYQDTGIPLVRIQNIFNGEVNVDETVYIEEVEKEEFSRFLLNKDDVLVAMTGATIGKTGRVSENILPAFLNQRVGRFVVNKNEIDIDYFFVILQTKIFTEQIKKLSLGGAQPNISPRSIEGLEIPMPPKERQKKIAVDVLAKRERVKRLRQEAESIVAGAEKQIEQIILA